MTGYIAIIHKDRDSDYGVSFPDFAGCVTAGNTIEEAKNMASEALFFHIKGMIEDGEEIPKPSTLEKIITDSVYNDAIAFLIVPVPELKPKTVRININLFENDLYQINNIAKKRGMSQSEFLVHAIKNTIKLSKERNKAASNL
ncbi:antitoxin HicB [Candidatus Magnetomoraceae bacterium gMMP-15]